MFWGQVGIGVLQLAALGVLTVLGRRLGRVVEAAVRRAVTSMQSEYCTNVCPVPGRLSALIADLGGPAETV